MRAFQLLSACVAIVLLPVAAIAEDKDTSAGATSSSSRKAFDKLDNDRDGRLSKLEAASDSTLTFSRVDTDGDGYIDHMEYIHRNGSGNPPKNAVPSSQSPQSSSPNSPGSSSKTDPNQAQGTQPAGSRPREESPRQ
jgi:EF hand